MKKYILIFGFLILTVNGALANQNCFVVKENNITLNCEGDCQTPYAPESTFKIALSLIGFDSGIFKTENIPSWSLPAQTDPYINVCKGAHTPYSWMRDSCLWYSRILTTKLGMKKFQSYITKFSYGNMDLSGDNNQNNGLTNAWVSSSLKISPIGQTDFLQKLIEHNLFVSKLSYEKTKEIMFIQEMAGGWKLFGKTGNGRQFDNNGNKNELQHGWFVGYIQKDNRHVVFAYHIVDTDKQSTFASFRARNDALTRLWYIINELEK